MSRLHIAEMDGGQKEGKVIGMAKKSRAPPSLTPSLSLSGFVSHLNEFNFRGGQQEQAPLPHVIRVLPFPIYFGAFSQLIANFFACAKPVVSLPPSLSLWLP